jgi:hypothetical protein
MIQCDMGCISKTGSYWWHTNRRFVVTFNDSAAKCYSGWLRRTAQFSAGLLCTTRIWYTEEPKSVLHLYCLCEKHPSDCLSHVFAIKIRHVDAVFNICCNKHETAMYFIINSPNMLTVYGRCAATLGSLSKTGVESWWRNSVHKGLQCLD